MDEGGIDWGHAETLAFASLLTEGTHIRLTGQDTERGTFSHRHLALHDENTGLRYVPIQHLAEATAPFELHNSPLSEVACLGFEYGYSAASPSSLILWEAQFGDFANAAQVIIDSFIVSGESKWGQTTRLTLLLPHGYEERGAGALERTDRAFHRARGGGEHPSSEPDDVGAVLPPAATPGQDRQATPADRVHAEGAAGLPAASARLEDLTDGRFEFVLDDPRAADRRDEVERLVLCSGKIYYDLDGHERRESARNVAIARVELLYPFASEQLAELISRYPNLKEITWVQEEPQNLGAWKVMVRRMPEIIPDGVEFNYIGRPERAPPPRATPPRTAPSRSGSCSRRSRPAGCPVTSGPTCPDSLVATLGSMSEAGETDRQLRPADALRKPVPGAFFPFVKWASYIELALFAALLFFWLAPGFEGETFVFGLSHGIGFIILCLLVWVAVLRREALHLLAATLTPRARSGA